MRLTTWILKKQYRREIVDKLIRSSIVFHDTGKLTEYYYKYSRTEYKHEVVSCIYTFSVMENNPQEFYYSKDEVCSEYNIDLKEIVAHVVLLHHEAMYRPEETALGMINRSIVQHFEPYFNSNPIDVDYLRDVILRGFPNIDPKTLSNVQTVSYVNLFDVRISKPLFILTILDNMSAMVRSYPDSPPDSCDEEHYYCKIFRHNKLANIIYRDFIDNYYEYLSEVRG